MGVFLSEKEERRDQTRASIALVFEDEERVQTRR